MMCSKRCRVLFFFVGLMAFILIVGFYLSDQVYYAKIIKTNHLKNPLDVFNWVSKNNPSAIGKNISAAPYVSPKYNMINRRTLYCDEGAIVMATLDHELGYPTRLVDLIGLDSISHHTILEVKENKEWRTYDFFRGNYGVSYEKAAGYPLLNIKMKPYPKNYNFLINHNYFLKKVAFLLRGIREE